MKKIFSIAIAALALTACAEMYGPKEESVPALGGQDIEITVTNVSDSSFTVTFAPKGEAAYYSYLIDESSEIEEVDPNDIYEVVYEGVAQGTVKYTEEQKSFTLEVEELIPDTDYVIYAVAGAKDGSVKTVAAKLVRTTDNVDPEVSDYQVDSNKVYILFADGSVYYDEEKKVTVRLYADENISDDIYEDTEVATMEADSVVVTVKGNIAIVEMKGIPAGAYFSVSFEEGTFVDATEHPCPAVESGFYADEDDELAAEGICGRMDNENFDVTFYAATEENDGNPDVVTDLTGAIWLNVPKGFVYGKLPSDVLATVLYDNGNARSEYDLPSGYQGGFLYGWSKYSCPVVYPWGGDYAVTPAPAPGTMVTITFPEGWLVDAYGNKANEFVIGPFLYSYGYEEDDIFGTYAIAYTSYWNGDYEGSLIIGEADYEWDEEEEEEEDPEYTVAITGGDIDGLPIKYDVLGWVDYDRGTLSFEGEQTIYFGAADTDKDGEVDTYLNYCLVDAMGADYIEFSVPASKQLVLDSSQWLGVVIYKYDLKYKYQGYSWYDIAKAIEFTYTEAEEGEGEGETTKLGTPVKMPKGLKHPSIKPVIK